MTKSDYLAQVEALKAGPALRARVASLPGTVKKRRHVGRWVGLCACLSVIVLGAGVFSGALRLPIGGSSAGGGGHADGSSVFMSYAGPVFPLAVRGEATGLSASRDITLDFSPWERVWWSNEEEAASRADLTEEERQEVLDNYNQWFPEGGRWRSSSDLLVTDAYVLTNRTGADQTVDLLYPFAASLHDLEERTPTLMVDGAAAEPILHAGGYAGGFEGAIGSEEVGTLNLAQPDSWEGYRALLSDGSYLEQALEGFPDLSGPRVIVYKFTGASGPQPDEEAGYPNPSIRAGFDLDYSRTTVLTYGFHGMTRSPEAGIMIQEFSIPQPGEPRYDNPCYLFVLGDDIQNLTVGGYVTGGTDPDTEPLPGCSVEVERYETDLESALRTAAELMFGFWGVDPEVGDPVDFELYLGLMKEFLTSCGLLAEEPAQRYQAGWLEELDFTVVDRVFYLEAQVTVPAGGSVTVEAALRKPASYDFYCAHTENRGIYGYDLVTRLGSALDFTGQTACLENAGCVDIVRQNFGFDPEHGVTRVALDPEQEHYYLEVRRQEGEK